MNLFYPSDGRVYVIDTDLGGDPDDALAVALAATLTAVRAIATCDELPSGGRANLAAAMLRACDRSDVAVCQGSGPRVGPDFFWTGAPEHRWTGATVAADLLKVLHQALEESMQVVWVGLGPMSNLASLARRSPRLIQQVHVVQMGGWLRFSRRTEHNFRLDPAGASSVVPRCASFTLVPADLTMADRNRLDPQQSLLEWLGSLESKWAKLVYANFMWWFTNRYPASYQHDALTLAIAADAIPATIDERRLSIDTEGRVTTSGCDLTCVRVVSDVDWDHFWCWTAQRLALLPGTSVPRCSGERPS